MYAGTAFSRGYVFPTQYNWSLKKKNKHIWNPVIDQLLFTNMTSRQSVAPTFPTVYQCCYTALWLKSHGNRLNEGIKRETLKKKSSFQSVMRAFKYLHEFIRADKPFLGN